MARGVWKPLARSRRESSSTSRIREGTLVSWPAMNSGNVGSSPRSRLRRSQCAVGVDPTEPAALRLL